MRIKIEGQQYKIPASLLEVTLSDRIEYDREHGKELREKLSKILSQPEGVDRDLDLAEYQCDVACRTLSFFGKIPIDIVRQVKLEEVLIIYHEIMQAYSAEANFADEAAPLNLELEWNEEVWCIAPPELKNASSTTFGEFLDAKQAVKNLFELANDRWESLLMLCCIYLRKAGEQYSEELSEEKGTRYQLMQTLPLAHALNVGFFLSASMSSYISTFHSFTRPENQASLSSANTSSSGNG